jgi:predicted phosphodiesterase
MYRTTRAAPLNPGFYSSLDHLMEFYDIDYWLHGHTHQSVEYEVGGCKVRMNPRGYGDAPENLTYNPELRIEV